MKHLSEPRTNGIVSKKKKKPHLNLVNVYMLVCFLHFFKADLHGINLNRRSRCRRKPPFMLEGSFRVEQLVSYSGFGVF